MSWAKFDDQYPDHPKIVEVGPLGMALHMAATCYCARYLTNGFVPAGMMPRLVSFDGITTERNGVTNPVTTKNVISELVKVGLFEIVEGGYFVHDYGEYNPSADEVKAQRTENAKKQRKWREEHRNDKGQFDRNPVSNRVTNPGRNTVPSPSPSPSSLNNNDGSRARPEIFSLYEKEIGALTPKISDWLIDAEKRYPPEWIRYSFDAAIRANVRKWNYIDGVLKRIETEGFQPNRPAETNSKSNGSKSGKKTDTSLDDLIRSGK